MSKSIKALKQREDDFGRLCVLISFHEFSIYCDILESTRLFQSRSIHISARLLQSTKTKPLLVQEWGEASENDLFGNKVCGDDLAPHDNIFVCVDWAANG